MEPTRSEDVSSIVVEISLIANIGWPWTTFCGLGQWLSFIFIIVFYVEYFIDSLIAFLDTYFKF